MRGVAVVLTMSGAPATIESCFRSSAISARRGATSTGNDNVGNAAGTVRVEVVLGLLHQRDHPLVRLARGIAEREHAVVHQHHADRALGRLGRIVLRALLRQRESRHHVVDEDDGVTEAVLDMLPAVRRVRHREHRVGVGVIDIARREDGVQDRLDRRRGRLAGARELQLLRHLRVGQVVELRQRDQTIEPDRREAGRGHADEVGSRSLDVERVDRVTEQVGLDDLHRRVPSTVHDERRIAAQQPRRVDALAQ